MTEGFAGSLVIVCFEDSLAMIKPDEAERNSCSEFMNN